MGQDTFLWCLPYGAGFMSVVFKMWGRIHACGVYHVGAGFMTVVFTNWGRIHDCGVYQLG